MAEPRTEGGTEPTPNDAGAGSRRRTRLVVPVVLVGVVVAVAAVVVTSLVARPDSSPALGSVSPSGEPAAPLIAIIDATGSLATMDERGGSVVTHAVPGVRFGFPAWSPDGSRIAVDAYGPGPGETAIDVFTAGQGAPGRSGGEAEPVVVYRSSDRPPFYLYWAPDGLKIAFLATESVGLSLRIAPADGSAPLDGSGPGAIIRKGAPLYFDWVGADRLLLHVGVGSDAFVGEVGLDGASVAPAVAGTGDFRSASVTSDGRYIAYLRFETASSGAIVVASRDGASSHDLAVFGPAAFVFAPTGDTLASIAADKPVEGAPPFPFGPLRLIEPASGSVRTLLDGTVLGFFWAPDGRTIAALRLAQPGDQTAEAGPVLADAALPGLAAATPPPGAAVRIAFVEVSTGKVRSERVVRLGSQFVNELFPYFDQYALSHRLWAPDSAAILLPVVDASGRTQVTLIPADGTDSRPIAEGVSGFWSR